MEWIRKSREEGRKVREWIEEREVQTQETFERIRRSKWNKWYKKVGVMGLPRYLKERRKDDDKNRDIQVRK